MINGKSTQMRKEMYNKYKKSSIESTAESIIRESELQYFATKSELVNAVQNYIDSVAPTSKIVGEEPTFNLSSVIIHL